MQIHFGRNDIFWNDHLHTVDGSEIRLTSWYSVAIPLFTGFHTCWVISRISSINSTYFLLEKKLRIFFPPSVFSTHPPLMHPTHPPVKRWVPLKTPPPSCGFTKHSKLSTEVGVWPGDVWDRLGHSPENGWSWNQLRNFTPRSLDFSSSPCSRCWLNQPIWKIWSSNGIIFPGMVGVKIKNVWNHHPVFVLSQVYWRVA